MQKTSYFDGNATTPLCKEAYQAWVDASENWWYNSSSPFSLGAATKVRLEQERYKLAKWIGCEEDEIVFNSGATEGNNSVMWALGQLCPDDKLVLVSSLEHPSVLGPAQFHLGHKLRFVSVNAEGVVTLDEIQEYLEKGNVYAISLMAANNETGVLQPWQKVLELCQEYQVLYHCDAAQWLGKLPDANFGKCTFVSGCAHKFGGPKGCGFLKYSKSIGTLGLFKGGNQEEGMRAGTEDYPSISAMLAALESYGSIHQQGRDQFEELLKEEVPDVKILGEAVSRLPQTSMVLLPRFNNDRWVTRLSKKGFLISTGSACSSSDVKGSKVLTSMGLSNEKSQRTVRISGGKWSTEESWHDLALAFGEVWQELQRSSGNPNIISID